MKRFLLLLLLLLVPTSREHSAHGQQGIALKTLSFEGSGITNLQLRPTFNSVRGYGGGAEARIGIAEHFSLGLQVGYTYLHVNQDDPVTHWNWAYWKSYYRNYINSDWLGDSAYFKGVKVKTSTLTNQQVTSGTLIIRKDSLYQARITAVQYANVLPVGISFIIDFSDPVGDGKLSPFLSIGAYAYIYERNLYLDEIWSKRRTADAGPDSGKVYTFTYGFHNYATKISGEVYGISGRAGTGFTFSDLVGLRLSVQYDLFLPWVGKSAYERFPLKSALTLNTGIVIHY